MLAGPRFGLVVEQVSWRYRVSQIPAARRQKYDWSAIRNGRLTNRNGVTEGIRTPDIRDHNAAL